METPRASQRHLADGFLMSPMQTTPTAAPELLDTPPMAPQIAPICSALQRGNYEAVACALNADPLVAFMPINGSVPPLVYAVQHQCPVAILELLLDRGALVNDVSFEGLTALEIVAGLKPPDTCLRFEPWALRRHSPWNGAPAAQLEGFAARVFRSPEDFWSGLELPMLPSPCAPKPCEDESRARQDQQVYCHQVALCLLRCGASPMRAAEIAEQAGHPSLPALIRHWSGKKARTFLRALWRKHDQAPHERSCGSLHVPTDLREKLCEFLAPTKWETTGESH